MTLTNNSLNNILKKIVGKLSYLNLGRKEKV